ncbi:hypothetical protein [Caulobacter hibisci]|uniref:Uncharacterized protein n=1 Tax=Caulobacter hibisci TaxID=2035993 RepID=A0ABS0SRS7_9CAUL|nr:hypothetical protein [Caulobacter hibisci]MBI1682330.1 hypothetical protein [Caulobacter hibisci]
MALSPAEWAMIETEINAKRNRFSRPLEVSDQCACLEWWEVANLMDAARAQGRQQATTSTGELRPLSPANAAAVEAVFGKPVMLDEEGEDWNALLDYVRAQGRASLEERCAALEEGLRTAIDIGGLHYLQRLPANAWYCDKVDEIRALLATPGERENG